MNKLDSFILQLYIYVFVFLHKELIIVKLINFEPIAVYMKTATP